MQSPQSCSQRVCKHACAVGPRLIVPQVEEGERATACCKPLAQLPDAPYSDAVGPQLKPRECTQASCGPDPFDERCRSLLVHPPLVEAELRAPWPTMQRCRERLHVFRFLLRFI
eukprot:3934523-Rhodomonas_salina.2